MTVIGTQDFAPDVLAVVVDADPTVTPVDAPRGSLIVFKPTDGSLSVYFTKDDDGSTTNVTALGGGGGGVVAVSSVTLGAPAATLDITGFDATSRLWLLVLSQFQPVNAGASPRALLREGGTFRTADYEHHTDISRANASGYAGSNALAATELEIGGFTGWNELAGRAGQMFVWIQDPANTVTRKWIVAEGAFYNSTPVLTWLNHRGAYNPAASTAAVDALRLQESAGNIAAGLTADLYKFANP